MLLFRNTGNLLDENLDNVNIFHTVETVNII